MPDQFHSKYEAIDKEFTVQICFAMLENDPSENSFNFQQWFFWKWIEWNWNLKDVRTKKDLYVDRTQGELKNAIVKGTSKDTLQTAT